MGMFGRQFFTADNLFGDEEAARRRGFASADEMDRAMIEAWNAVVYPKDIVWVLGNFHTSARLGLTLLDRLQGSAYLVAGELDWVFPPGQLDDHALQSKITAYRVAGFKGVVTGAGVAKRTGRPVALPLRGWSDAMPRSVIVSSFPYDATERERGQSDRFATWRPKRSKDDQGRPMWLLHGHQAEWVVRQNQVNVGADQWGFEPVEAEVVTALIEDSESGSGAWR